MTYLALEAGLTDKWPLVEFRRVAAIRRETNSQSSETLLALSAHTGVRPRPEDGGNQLPSDETITKYWVAYPGDLVFNPMWALEGGVAVSDIRGALSTAYRVYELGPKLFPRFVHYFLRSTVAIDQYNLLVRGVTTFDRAVKREDFEPMPIPVPPIEVQKRIADYLDQETKRIDRLITSKSSLITLLEARWQATVDDVLQNSLEAPEYPLKHLSVLNPESWGETSEPETEISYLDISAVGTGVLRSTPEEMTFENAPSRARRIARTNDVLISTVRTYLRSVWTIPGEYDGVTVSTGFAVLRPNSSLNPRYLGYACLGSKFIDEVVAQSVGVSYPAINASDLIALKIKVPSRSTQDQIVRHLDLRWNRENETIAKLSKSVSLLQERRQALVTAAVTGQLEI